MGRGGARLGAGRPKGQGRYQETTKPLRVPESMIPAVLSFIENKTYKLPFFSSTVAAGFPSPADDYIEAKLDLNELLVKHPAASFFVRVAGNSMINAGIHHNDILLVDRSLEPIDGKIVIAALNGQLTVKRLKKNKGKVYLMPENESFPPIEVNPEQEIYIWGIVTNVIHAL